MGSSTCSMNDPSSCPPEESLRRAAAMAVRLSPRSVPPTARAAMTRCRRNTGVAGESHLKTRLALLRPNKPLIKPSRNECCKRVGLSDELKLKLRATEIRKQGGCRCRGQVAKSPPADTLAIRWRGRVGLSYHSGDRTVGPMSRGPGRPGAGGCGSPAGASNPPQLVRARIWSRVAAVTKSLSSRICHPPPRAR